MISHSKYHYVDGAIMYGFAVLSIIFLSATGKFVHHSPQLSEVPSLSVKKADAVVFNPEVFSDVMIHGKSYIVYDIVDKKIISSKNENTVLPLASITKVMTAFTARTHFDKRKSIVVTKKSIEGVYDLGLHNGQVFDLDELLKYMLVFSSNDGAQAVADNLGGRESFISLMNEDAKRFGLSLQFTQPAGLDEYGKIGGQGSAYSVAKLLALANGSFPEIFESTIKKRANVNSITGKITGVPNTNQEVYSFSGLLMSKTGYTDKAGGNLAVIVDVTVGRPVAIVVLGSTKEERFSDVKLLYNTLLKSVVQ